MNEIEDLDIEHYFLYLYNFIKEMKEKKANFDKQNKEDG